MKLVIYLDRKESDIITTRLGEIKKNKQGTLMKIVRYGSSEDIDIEFMDDFHYIKEHQAYINFKNGSVKNPYDKSVYGIGYIGEGGYKVYIDQDHLEPRYNVWRTLLGRCCTEKHREQFPAYANCEVCEEWLNYQTFSKWYEDNFYQVGTERMHIDKDILYKNNRLYSPETCLLVPQRINLLFMSKSNKYGLPTGIKPTDSGKYETKYCGKHLGTFNTIEEAELAHEEAKRKAIKEVAEEYKPYIPDKVYRALLAW